MTAVRPSRLRVAAALLTSATATLMLVQLMRIGDAAEPTPPPAPAPLAITPAVTPRALEDKPLVVPADPVDTVLPARVVPKPHKPSRLTHLMPVKHFGGY